MLDTTQYSVGELRDLLVNQYGVSREEADSITPKAAVKAKLRELQSDDEILESAEEVVDAPSNQVVQSVDQEMNANNPKWTEHVISLMFADELFEGHPKVDGLRRIAELIAGPILQVSSDVVQTPDMNNNFHATVKVTVATNDMLVDGCADAGPNNTDRLFSKHPVAVAESRAEGRAYRKLLRLRNIISAEEVVKDDQILDEYEVINNAQVKTIDRMCSDSNINVEKWLKTQGIDLGDFSKTTKTKATELCGKLNTLRGTGEIPADILGYDFNWRN